MYTSTLELLRKCVRFLTKGEDEVKKKVRLKAEDSLYEPAVFHAVNRSVA
jgi:hypothetical protein